MLERIRRWRADPVVAATWAAAVVPIVVAAWRAIADGWRPIGDNALVGLRARDVLTADHPWLGTWSSASLEAGQDLNHPGPLLFDAVALPVRIFGSGPGIVLGVALVNLLAVTTIACFGRRQAGRAGAVALLCGAIYLEFIMGSELLVDPWNPHVLMLPCLAMLVCAWGVAVGDRWALPVYLAIGSYCVQTHLGYSYLVPLLLIAVVAVRFAQRGRGVAFIGRVEVAWSAGALAVLWLQPLIEQFTGEGEGNLTRVLGARGSEGLAIGPSLAVRLFTGVVTRPPWTARTGFIEAVPSTGYESPGVLRPFDVISGPAAAVRLLLVVAIVAAAAWLGVRRRDRQGVLGVVTAAAAMVIALGSLVIMPVGPIGLTAHQMRWLWPIGVFAVCAVVVVAARALPWTVPAWTGPVVAGVLAVLVIPAYVQPAGPAARRDLIPVVAELDAQLGVLEGIGTVWIDTSRTPAFDNYDAAVMLELQRRGVPFVVDEPGLVRQVGDRRRFDGTRADARLWLLRGRDALRPPPEPGDVVAVATVLTEDELAELADLELLVADGVVLSDDDAARLEALLAAADTASVAVVISAPA